MDEEDTSVSSYYSTSEAEITDEEEHEDEEIDALPTTLPQPVATVMVRH